MPHSRLPVAAICDAHAVSCALNHVLYVVSCNMGLHKELLQA